MNMLCTVQNHSVFLAEVYSTWKVISRLLMSIQEIVTGSNEGKILLTCIRNNKMCSPFFSSYLLHLENSVEVHILFIICYRPFITTGILEISGFFQ